jgi:hypothetical protein
MRNLSVIRFYLIPNGNIGNSKPRFVFAPDGLATVNTPVLSARDFMDTVLQRKVSNVVANDFWYREQEQKFPVYYHLQILRATLSVYNAYQRRELRQRMYFDRDGEALKITAAIAESFTREVEALGSRPFVGIIPMRDLLDAHAAGTFPLADMLSARSVPVLDVGPALAARARELGEDALFLPDGHLTPLGNRLVADEFEKRLFGGSDSASK